MYGCDRDFPARIPDVLGGLGATVEQCRDQTEVAGIEKPFEFRLTRALAAVRIFGGEEEGHTTFAVVWGRNFNPFTWRASRHLSDEVQAQLVSAGARPLWQDEEK